jgi:hypothetical protein
MPQASTGRTNKRQGGLAARSAVREDSSIATTKKRKEKGPRTGKNTFWSINAKSWSGLLVTGGAGFICLFPLHTRGDGKKKEKKRKEEEEEENTRKEKLKSAGKRPIARKLLLVLDVHVGMGYTLPVLQGGYAHCCSLAR